MFEKIGFHFGGSKDINVLMRIEPMKITATGYDQVEGFSQINKIWNRAHSFMIRIMAFEA
ncbi:MAG: hypothetical protein HOF21_11175 [Nitrospina sp.]|nr:hypothetical protein [Nitrospina sp.]